MGAAGRSFIEASGMLDTGWDAVIDGLLSPLLSPDIAGRNKVIGV